MFNAAAEIADPAARAAFLDSACQGDNTLRARVERLLLADSQAGKFLIDRADASERSSEKVGDRIGRYRLLERLGRGGWGVVYLAEQEEPVRREVALKVIKLGMDTRSVVARFEAERQALALMDHANIARVLDAGATETGRPFFVMELVRGIPITEYCDQHGLSCRQRLELFIQICQAVQHAHQKGIIHRDLKPSNILVATHDGPAAAAAPKVIDFGIAKATEQRLTEHTALTGLHEFIGTPAYMSPEQVGLGDGDVDTRSDIYSLGVILYELVTGQPPFAPQELTQGGLDEMRRIIREVDPPRPSTTITRNLDSNRRRSTRGPAREQLAAARGDLDWIVMKCLEKDRARRYETANSLATDIRRHLDNETISARPPTAWYRFQKIVRRNPRVAALTALLFLALAAGLSGVLFMNVRLTSANRQKELANVQLAAKLRDFEWQNVEELVATGKRGDALALLSDMLRRHPRDAVAAMRIFSMLNGGNFGLPRTAPLQHGAAVNSVSVSGDGQRALTASSDGKARLWDLQNGGLLASLTHTGKVTSARFADDDRLVMTQCQDGTFWLWDFKGSNFLLEATQPPDWTVTPAFSRDRRRLALPETENSVRIWDLPARRPLCSIKMPARILHVAFSPDSNVVAVAAKDRSIVLWTLHESRPAEALVKLPGGVKGIEFSPDGRILVATLEWSITFWDTQTWTTLHEFKPHEGEILMFGISPDGRTVVTAPWNEPLKIWDITSGKMIGQPIEAEQPHSYFRFRPDGKSLATRSQSGVARAWDAVTGRAISEPCEHAGPITDLAFTPDNRSLVTSSQDGTAQVWDIQHGRSALSILKAERAYSSACFSRDNRYVLGTDGERALKFDAATGTQVGKPIIHANPIYRIKASPDGRKFVTAAWESSTARVWDMETGEPRTPLLKHSDRLLGVAFSADSRFVATASQDTTVRVWDAETGEPKTPSLRHDADVMHVAFRGDSRRLLSTSVDGTARLWSTEDGHAVWPEPIHHKGIVWTAEFDPDGRRIVTASADRSAMVWDAESRRPLIRPIRHERGVKGARFSPDGHWVLTWSEDGTARVWDSQNGQAVSQPMRHRDKVTAADFSPDGTGVLTGSMDGVVRLWDAFSGYPLSEPLHNAGRINAVEFSPDGRRFLSFADKDALKIWDIVTPPVPVPDWFCDLVEAVAGKRLSANRDAEPVARDSLQPLRQRFADIQDSDFYSRWANWFIWKRMQDPAPEFVP